MAEWTPPFTPGNPAAPTPAELGYLWALERPEVFERCTVNLYATDTELVPREAWAARENLSDAEQARWREKTHQRFRDFIAAWEDIVRGDEGRRGDAE